MIDDKLYIVLVLVLVGIFIYWYQKRIDNIECQKCLKRKNRRRNKRKPNVDIAKKSVLKTVRFKDNETDVSLDSLDSSDHIGLVSNNDDNDSKSCDTLDI
tara:strand:- start:195 stop:494 length:300 start_codon:yes stop_codon:yes gene_type:complete